MRSGARGRGSLGSTTWERMRKRTPSGASREKPLPRPGTTSTVRRVWDHTSNWLAGHPERHRFGDPLDHQFGEQDVGVAGPELAPGKHMGALPSQQPPDWWNISGPCAACSRRSSSAAAGVSSTRGISSGIFTALVDRAGRCERVAGAAAHGRARRRPPLRDPSVGGAR